MQESVHRRLSQRFRNMRRYSEQLQAPGTTIVKASLSNPETETIRSRSDSITTDQDDRVAYKRNMESLLQELKKPRPQTELVEKLLALTFEKRRRIIDDSLLHTADLMDEFPFLKVKTWVSS